MAMSSRQRTRTPSPRSRAVAGLAGSVAIPQLRLIALAGERRRDVLMLPELLTRDDVSCPYHGPVLRLSVDQGEPGDWFTHLECPECGYEVQV